MTVSDDWLEKIIAADDLGLLEVKAAARAPTSDEHLVSKFQEITDFVSRYDREPIANQSNIIEFQLSARLKGIRQDAAKIEQLKTLDQHGLLANIAVNEESDSFAQKVAEPKTGYENKPKEINSLEDIFNDDLGLFDDTPDDIFNLKHIPAGKREKADYIATRKPCKNFADYKEGFKAVHDEIRTGERLLKKFDDKGQSLVAGQYYLLSGVLLYLEKIDITSPEKTIEGRRFRKDGRTRCIFENGAESNMLYRSLAKALYNDGKIVTATNEQVIAETETNLVGLSDDDKSTGYIYILRSLSNNSEINSINNLYKIGYSTTPVQQRIANAEKEPTYLMAPVEVVAVYETYNTNTQKFEAMLHRFFGKACLDIEITDLKGKTKRPREWFIAPLDVVESAIGLLVSGEIVKYRYDYMSENILETENS